jgi:hypothetical protein
MRTMRRGTVAVAAGLGIIAVPMFGSVVAQARVDPGQSVAASVETIDTTYSPDDSIFLNPERGFHNTAEDYSSTREEGYSVARVVVRLDDFRAKDISQEKLDQLDAIFTNAQKSGVKVMPQFMYNFPENPGDESDPANGDAPLELVLRHLDQLKPVFQKHVGVISNFSNGFIGAWGEWHDSSNGLDKEPARSKVWNKMLEVIPAERMMTVRTVQQHTEVTGAKTAAPYDGSNASRTGVGNQCFLASKNDVGTYDWDDVEGDKKKLEKITQYTATFGETCQIQSGTNREDCATAAAELERFHYSILNDKFYEPVLTGWKKNGCYDDFNRRMGYRFQLGTSAVQKSVSAGSAFSTSFTVKNVGYAAPFNPRGLSVVLREQRSGKTYPMSVVKAGSATLDPRMWFRESGEITVKAAPTVPKDVPAGTYDVMLALPDPVAELSTRPEYSIRLANQSVWDEKTGMNLLAKGVQVTR